MGCGSRRTKEGKKARSLSENTVSGSYIGLLQGGPSICRKQDVAWGDRRAVGIVENLSWTIRTEYLCRIRGPSKRERSCVGAVPVSGGGGDGVETSVVSEG